MKITLKNKKYLSSQQAQTVLTVIQILMHNKKSQFSKIQTTGQQGPQRTKSVRGKILHRETKKNLMKLLGMIMQTQLICNLMKTKKVKRLRVITKSLLNLQKETLQRLSHLKARQIYLNKLCKLLIKDLKKALNGKIIN